MLKKILFQIQPNSDGQPTVQLMPQMPQTLQLSTQAIQNLNIQQQIQQQIQAQLAAQQHQQQQQQQIQITPQMLQSAFNQQLSQQTISISAPQSTHIIAQPSQQQVSVDTQVTQADIAMEESNMQEIQQTPIRVQPPTPTPIIVEAPTPKLPVATNRVPPKRINPAKKIKQEPAQVVTQQQQQRQQQPQQQQQQSVSDGNPSIESIIAQQQISTIAGIKHDGPNPPSNLTTCEVCKKVFKRKEHLMQHLKSHVGLRPFKCDQVGCNKSFSRKEHLMRHIVSHTGKKMFSCDFCHKFFSRKDNLNKHRR